MAASAASVLDVTVQSCGIGQYRFSIAEVDQPFLAGRHHFHKGFGLLEDLFHLARDQGGVDRGSHGQVRIVVGAVASVATDFSDETFRRIARVFGDSGPYDCAERNVALMYEKQIKDIARFAPSSRSQCFVRREIENVKPVTE